MIPRLRMKDHNFGSGTPYKSIPQYLIEAGHVYLYSSPILGRFLIPNLESDSGNRSGGHFSAGYRLEKLFVIHKTILSPLELCVLPRTIPMKSWFFL